MRAEFYIQHETSPWSVIVFSYDFERSFFGEADLYWDEPPTDEYTFWAITFIGHNAWHWDEMEHGYRLLIHDGRLTDDGRVKINRLLHVSTPMVDYGL